MYISIFTTCLIKNNALMKTKSVGLNFDLLNDFEMNSLRGGTEIPAGSRSRCRSKNADGSRTRYRRVH